MRLNGVDQKRGVCNMAGKGEKGPKGSYNFEGVPNNRGLEGVKLGDSGRGKQKGRGKGRYDEDRG